MEHNISTLRLIEKNSAQRARAALAVLAVEIDTASGPVPIATDFTALACEVDGDVLARMRHFNQSEMYGYYLAAVDAHETALNTLRGTDHDDEAVA